MNSPTVAASLVLAALAGSAWALTQPPAASTPAPAAQAPKTSPPANSGAPGLPTDRYPATARVDVTDDYHGTKVADPFRWLEDANSAETKAWVDAQNAVTFNWLGQVPQREAIKSRLTSIWNYERFSTPYREGGRYFFSRNDGLQPQSVLLVADRLDATPRPLLDPNTMSKDGTVALAGTRVSNDGKLIAYGVAEAGSDWNVWRVRNIDTGQDLPDELRWVKFSGASWTKDNAGFFYSRYDAPAEGQKLQAVNRFPKVFYHRVGTPQSEDLLVYERPDQPNWGFGAGVTDDGRFLVMNVSQGTDRRNRFFYRDLSAVGIEHKPTEIDQRLRQFEREQGAAVMRMLDDEKATPAQKQSVMKALEEATKARSRMVAAGNGSAHGFVELLDAFDASYDFIDNVGTRFLFLTDLDAPRGRVIAIDIEKPGRENWQTVIPQGEGTLAGVNLVGGKLIANYMRDAASQVLIFTPDGKLEKELELPGIGSAGGFGGKASDTETFFSFTGYTTPPTIFRYDIPTGQTTVFKRSGVQFDPARYLTTRSFYQSKDGTRVPIFVTHRKDLTMDGSNPTLLYGYGGFNVSLTPSFSPVTAVWLEMGGVYAVANLRGGGEYGEEWHQSGTKLRKQNVFDDFIAAGEWLVENKYTRPDRLAIQGGSNGGLLVGAVITQRPELFGAALPAVGVMDMLRFHQFTIGWAWKSDYGSSENPDEFKALLAYSPYHVLLRQAEQATPVKYPATMVTTADHDDRVVPAHSFKFAAALQASGARDGKVDAERPLMIRIETRAGHGAGKPTAKRIEEAADIFAFLVRALRFKPDLGAPSAPPANAQPKPASVPAGK